MKEYLLKTEDGTYHYHNDSHDVCPKYVEKIEIPEGAEICLDLSLNLHAFYKDNFKKTWCDTRWEDTVQNSLNLKLWNDMPVLWQRAKQPEELQFLDDGPSLNDQYAEIEQVRQASITDTLNERQSTYGSFEDVALTTQKIMDAIAWSRGQDKLPAPHYEALHMIASKMARIVNGDHNHKDSWHDIAGYATLVERLL